MHEISISYKETSGRWRGLVIGFSDDKSIVLEIHRLKQIESEVGSEIILSSKIKFFKKSAQERKITDTTGNTI